MSKRRIPPQGIRLIHGHHSTEPAQLVVGHDDVERPHARPAQNRPAAVLVLLDGLALVEHRRDIFDIQAPLEHSVDRVLAEANAGAWHRSIMPSPQPTRPDPASSRDRW